MIVQNTLEEARDQCVKRVQDIPRKSKGSLEFRKHCFRSLKGERGKVVLSKVVVVEIDRIIR